MLGTAVRPTTGGHGPWARGHRRLLLRQVEVEHDLLHRPAGLEERDDFAIGGVWGDVREEERAAGWERIILLLFGRLVSAGVNEVCRGLGVGDGQDGEACDVRRRPLTFGPCITGGDNVPY